MHKKNSQICTSIQNQLNIQIFSLKPIAFNSILSYNIIVRKTQSRKAERKRSWIEPKSSKTPYRKD